jgi:hypothetical protein
MNVLGKFFDGGMAQPKVSSVGATGNAILLLKCGDVFQLRNVMAGRMDIAAPFYEFEICLCASAKNGFRCLITKRNGNQTGIMHILTFLQGDGGSDQSQFL